MQQLQDQLKLQLQLESQVQQQGRKAEEQLLQMTIAWRDERLPTTATTKRISIWFLYFFWFYFLSTAICIPTNNSLHKPK